MKYFVLAFVILFFVLYGFLISQRGETLPIRGANAIQRPPQTYPPDNVTTSDAESVELPYPVTISINKINVKANIEHVGLDEEKKMDVPKDYDNVGWYTLGYFPGERGSVVMAGHVDTEAGDPAVFANIGKLTAGDTIVVKDSINKQYTYVVVDKQVFAYDKVPLLRVFGSTDFERLNLITCTGTFDEGEENYSERLVVYAIDEEHLPEYNLLQSEGM